MLQAPLSGNDLWTSRTLIPVILPKIDLNGSSEHVPVDLTYSVYTCFFPQLPQVFLNGEIHLQPRTGMYNKSVCLFHVYWWVLIFYCICSISRRGSLPISKTFGAAFEDTQPAKCAKVVISFAPSWHVKALIKLSICVEWQVYVVMWIWVTAETGSRVGPFYRSSHSPQSSGQRGSCGLSLWLTFCSQSSCKAQWGGHNLSEQGEFVRNEMLKTALIQLFDVLCLLILCAGNGSRGELCSCTEWS